MVINQLFFTPQKATFLNNISAIHNHSFVEEATEEMLKAGAILEEPSEVVNPLSLSINSAGKKEIDFGLGIYKPTFIKAKNQIF